MRVIVALLVAFIAAGSAGCASLYVTFAEPGGDDVYGGTRLDGRIIGSAVTAGRVACGLRDCDPATIWFMVPLVLPDLCLSVISDTVLLPYTVLKEPSY